MNIELKHTVFVGSENVIKSMASRGCIRVLNRKTMRWQNFAADASFASVKDPDVETGWILLCDRDVRVEATQQGYII